VHTETIETIEEPEKSVREQLYDMFIDDNSYHVFNQWIMSKKESELDDRTNVYIRTIINREI
jgi:hypothetical protein